MTRGKNYDMKKRVRLLAILSATFLLVGGCGTSMYELTEDEETLITQYAAYAVGKHNIHQKDGMTSDKPKEEDTTKNEQSSTQQKPDSKDTQSASSNAGPSGENTADTLQYPEISIAGALGYDSKLSISYKGYKLEDAYKEGNYFTVNAASGNTLLVMRFTIVNKGKKAVKYDTSSLGNTFYGVFDGTNKIVEKVTFSNKELSSSTKTIKAGKKVSAIMLFEISKEAAANISTETLLVDMDGTTYQVKM